MMKYLSYILLAVAASSMSSCSDKEYNDSMMLSDIVTIAETGSTGTVFTFNRYDDSPLVTLTAPGVNIDSEWRSKRVLLRYYSESGQPYTSGNITPVAVNAINFDTIRPRNLDDYNLNADSVFLNSVWRSGRYINMRMRVEYSEKPRLFGLIYDSLAVSDDIPDLYLLHDRLGEPDNYMTEAYASFDISPLWDSTSCKAVRIHINDLNNRKDCYIFSKQD